MGIGPVLIMFSCSHPVVMDHHKCIEMPHLSHFKKPPMCEMSVQLVAIAWISGRQWPCHAIEGDKTQMGFHHVQSHRFVYQMSQKNKVSRKQLPSQDISRYLKSRFATSMALDGTGSQFDLTPDTIPAQAAVCPHFQKVVRLIICSGGR